MFKKIAGFAFIQRKLLYTFLFLFIFANIGKSATLSEFRTWNLGRAGNFYAELVEVSEDSRKVTLRGKSGNKKTGSIAALSKEDQEYIRKQQANGTIPTATKPAKPAVPANTAAELDEVVATGIGANQNTALKNALRNAVSQAAGSLVSAERLIENGELVKNQILSHSSGFVESHTVIGKPTTTDDGLVEIQIRAKVRRVKLSQEFERLGIQVITPGQFEASLDGEGLFSQAFTKIEMKESEAKMVGELKEKMNARAFTLEEVLEGYPENVLAAKMVGKPKYDETTATISFDVVTSIDMEKYALFVDNIHKALTQIGGRRTTKNLRGKYDRMGGEPCFSLDSSSRNLLDAMPDSCIAICKTWPIARPPKLYNEREFTTTWSIYEVGDAAFDIATKVAKRPIYLKIDLMDKDDTSILSVKQITQSGVGIDRDFKQRSYDKGVFFFPAAQVWSDQMGMHGRVNHYGNGGAFWGTRLGYFRPGTQEHAHTVKVDASLEDLAEIKNVKMRFEKGE